MGNSNSHHQAPPPAQQQQQHGGEGQGSPGGAWAQSPYPYPYGSPQQPSAAAHTPPEYPPHGSPTQGGPSTAGTSQQWQSFYNYAAPSYYGGYSPYGNAYAYPGGYPYPQAGYAPPQPGGGGYSPQYWQPGGTPGAGSVRPQAPAVEHMKEIKTVRNPVNVKRTSVRLERDEQDPSKRVLCFTFDATVAGKMGVYYVAQEGPYCEFTAMHPDLYQAAPVSFQKGLNQRFRQPAEAAVDLSLFPREQLEAVQSGGGEEVFPLVICMISPKVDPSATNPTSTSDPNPSTSTSSSTSTSTSSGAAGAGSGVGSRWAGMVPGEPLDDDVQAQMTYAVLKRRTTGGGGGGSQSSTPSRGAVKAFGTPGASPLKGTGTGRGAAGSGAGTGVGGGGFNSASSTPGKGASGGLSLLGPGSTITPRKGSATAPNTPGKGSAPSGGTSAGMNSLVGLGPGAAEREPDDEDVEWEVRVVKQRIWVDGAEYDLQEIYGMEDCAGKGGGGGGEKSTPGADSEDGNPLGGAELTRDASSSSSDMGVECVICLSNPRNTTVLPCRHMCMCGECAEVLRFQSNKCPICRHAVEGLLQIKISQRKDATPEDLLAANGAPTTAPETATGTAAGTATATGTGTDIGTSTGTGMGTGAGGGSLIEDDSLVPLSPPASNPGPSVGPGLPLDDQSVEWPPRVVPPQAGALGLSGADAHPTESFTAPAAGPGGNPVGTQADWMGAGPEGGQFSGAGVASAQSQASGPATANRTSTNPFASPTNSFIMPS